MADVFKSLLIERPEATNTYSKAFCWVGGGEEREGILHHGHHKLKPVSVVSFFIVRKRNGLL